MENLSEYIILIYFYGDTQGAKYFSARSSALHPISESSHIPPLHILRAGNMNQLRPSMPSQLLQFLLPNLWRQGDCCAAWDSPLGARPFKPRLQAPLAPFLRFTRFAYRWSLMVALLLLASRAERGSYGAPVAVPASSARSTAFAGRPQEFPENKNVAWSTT